MCENSPLFQHLHNKFFVNDESLQIHERWHERVVEKIAIDCGRMRSNTYRRFYIMSEVRLGDFAHNVGQWIILNHVYDETIGCCIWGTFSLHSKSNRTSTVPLLTNLFCREQSMITNGALRKKVVKVRLEVFVSVVALAETRV